MCHQTSKITMAFVTLQPSPSPEVFVFTEETVNTYQQLDIFAEIQEVLQDPPFTLNIFVLPVERCDMHLVVMFALSMMVSVLFLVSRSRRIPTVVMAEAVEPDFLEKGVIKASRP